MSREINEDFSSLVAFLKGYNLTSLAINEDFLKIISQLHKKYFAYLTFIAELTYLQKKGQATALSVKQIEFITESCSDVGSSIFVMTQGAYKASRMMLRSSIETFIKGFNLDEIPDLDSEKSVYAIFDKVKALSFFQIEPNKALLESIHQDYKLLCKDTHTATALNMRHITAMKYFPSFDIAEATQLKEFSIRLVSNYNTLLGIKYNSLFHLMHYKNKENILESIQRKFKPLLLGVEK
ncbi:hypothetical protein [Pontibacter chitinilyticus]|uniref:hypothetical protein n=1 Tax=Pontibacter chitinilyticus TaxID=2674989 RepID=UPI0032192C91